MLKVGTKRRRTKTQIASEKEEELLKEVALQSRLEKLEQDARDAESNKAAANILNDLL